MATAEVETARVTEGADEEVARAMEDLAASMEHKLAKAM